MTTHYRNNFWLGVDLSNKSFDVALVATDTPTHQWRKVPGMHIDQQPDTPGAIKRLMRWVKEAAPPAGQCQGICVESTGPLSKRFAKILAAQTDWPAVSIVNPARPKAYGQSLGVREKTDDIDAIMLAMFGVHQRPAPTLMPSPQEEKIKELDRLREDLVKDRTAWTNRLKSCDDPTTKAVIKNMLDAIEKNIDDTNKNIDEIIDQTPMLSDQVQWMRQIQGIGNITARTLTAELGRLDNYKRTQITAAAGAFPKLHESGSSVWRPPRMAKGGGARLRRVLYMCATSLMAHPGPWRQYIQNMKDRNKSDMCIIGALMRKLLITARAVVKNQGRYDPQKIGRHHEEKKRPLIQNCC